MTRTPTAACLLMAVMSVVASAAQREGDIDAGRLGITSITGEDSFNFYCATCHGRDAKGGGPVAAALTTKPADLTTLGRRNRGTFPRAEVIAYVNGTGRPLPAHGPADMPVWGPIFRALENSDPRVKVRIENIVTYIESLQLP
jgi:mono/diheme cytochrome c family protein